MRPGVWGFGGLGIRVDMGSNVEFRQVPFQVDFFSVYGFEVIKGRGLADHVADQERNRTPRACRVAQCC